MKQFMRFQRLVGMMDQGHIGRIPERPFQQPTFRQLPLHQLKAVLGENDGPHFFVEIDMVLVLQKGDQGVDRAVQFRPVIRWTRNDQGGPSLVDQDGVNFIDNGKCVAPLGHLLERILHIVAQIIEAELIIGAVGDVGGIGGLALRVAQALLDDPRGHAEETVNGAHPLRVARRQIIVDCDNVNALSSQGIQIDRQGGHQCFALTCAHFSNRPGMQDHAAQKLHIKMPHAQRTFGRLANNRKGLHEEVIEGLAGRQTGPELLCFCGQRRVRELLHGRFQCVDCGNTLAQWLELAVVDRTKNLLGKGQHERRNHLNVCSVLHMDILTKSTRTRGIHDRQKILDRSPLAT